MAVQILGKVGVVPKGEYNNATSYQRLDIVTYNGQSYISKANTTGNLPTDTTYWQLLAQKGSDGQDGEDGYTPVKGTDYYTTAEKTEMEADVKQAVENDIAVTLSNKQNKTDNSLQTINKSIVSAINEVNNVAKGANQSLSYSNYSAMITAFNALANNVYNVGQNIMIVTLEVPDLWVSAIESTSSSYTYTTDEAFTTALKTNGFVQVGYYKLSALETQKVDLSDYAKTTDIPTALSQLTEDTTHRLVTDTEKTTWNGKGTYSKPSGGIPSTDMTTAVQTSLGKADSALQSSIFSYDGTTETLTITVS